MLMSHAKARIATDAWARRKDVLPFVFCARRGGLPHTGRQVGAAGNNAASKHNRNRLVYNIQYHLFIARAPRY